MKLEHFYRPGPGSRLELARAYIPYQQYTNNYPLEEALAKGTFFPELWKPYRREGR